MKLLLDTCVFLWVSQQPSKLSKAAVAAIDEPLNELLVSDVSIWEITLKHSAGKLPLPAAPRTWIPAKFAFHGIQHLALGIDDIFLSGEMPRVHYDPFDRLLAAQAIGGGMSILSPDSPLSLLGASRVW